jgi:hypothetical protein
VWLYHRRVRSVFGFKTLALITIAILPVLSLVRAVRDVSGPDKLSASAILDAWRGLDNPAVAAIAEMGRTQAITAYTLNLVPSVQPFAYGTSYLYASLSLFPNVSDSVHPSVRLGSPATSLVNTVDPTRAQVGGGLGYSFIAEAYYNFGWTIGVLSISVLGALYGRLVIWADKEGSTAELALLAAFTFVFLVYARGESASIFRGLAWYAAIPYFAIRLLCKPTFIVRHHPECENDSPSTRPRGAPTQSRTLG